MKKLFTTISAMLFLSVFAQAQVVINEILYNIPGNTEAEEFIEFYNAGSTAVDLQNYTFTQGVTHTFTGGTIAPGGYFVIVEDSTAYHNTFGMAPDAVWTTGGLSNSGEDITLYDNNGVLVDSVNYDDVAPWPTDADGNGRSLQLCDHTTDNNIAGNWGITNTAAGVNSTSDSLYATPGAANNCVTITPPPPPTYPLYTIQQVNGVDSNGVADSLNVTCEIRGVAHCQDFRGGSGLDFPILNSNNSAGLRVFNFNDINNYTVAEGDSLHMWGTVNQFSGLLQFIPDSIHVVSQGNATATPMVVTALNESTENRLISLVGVHIVDTSAWTGTGSGFNVQVTTGNTDTFTLRIDNNTDLYNQPAPLGSFNVTGFGGQFDSSNPHTSGYQLQPCSMGIITSTDKIENQAAIAIFPNPTYGVLNVQSSVEIESISIFNNIGQEVKHLNNVNTNMAQVATQELANGVYFIRIVAGSKLTTKQFQVAK